MKGDAYRRIPAWGVTVTLTKPEAAWLEALVKGHAATHKVTQTGLAVTEKVKRAVADGYAS